MTRPTHFDPDTDQPSMVDVGDKPITRRRAVAEAVVVVGERLARAIADGTVPKGNLFEVARIAGVQAAKRTDELIPLCHGLPLDVVRVELSLDGCLVRIRAEACATARTGVEMEALTAATVAALTVVDMGKSVDRNLRIDGVQVVAKSGGGSGDWTRPPP